MIKELERMLIDRLIGQIIYAIVIVLIFAIYPSFLLLPYCIIFAIIYGFIYIQPRIRYIKTEPQNVINTFIAKNPELSIEIIENDFHKSLFKNSTISVGESYTIFIKDGFINIFENKHLIAISYSTWSRRPWLSWRFSNGSKYHIQLSVWEIKKILPLYQKLQPNLVLRK